MEAPVTMGELPDPKAVRDLPSLLALPEEYVLALEDVLMVDSLQQHLRNGNRGSSTNKGESQAPSSTETELPDISAFTQEALHDAMFYHSSDEALPPGINNNMNRIKAEPTCTTWSDHYPMLSDVGQWISFDVPSVLAVFVTFCLLCEKGLAKYLNTGKDSAIYSQSALFAKKQALDNTNGHLPPISEAEESSTDSETSYDKRKTMSHGYYPHGSPTGVMDHPGKWDDRGDPYSVIAAAQEERIVNLMAQNGLLHRALEEQRAAMQKIQKEMQCRAQGEAGREQTLKDLTAQVSLLQQQRDNDRRTIEVEAAGQGVLVQKVQTLSGMVNRQDDAWTTMESRQAAVQEEVRTKFKALEEATEAKLQALHEATQRESNIISPTVQKDEAEQEQLQAFRTKLEGMQRDLGTRSIQMTKLGQYLKARDERMDLKTAGIEQQCATLDTKLQDLTEDSQSQRVHVTNMEQELQTNRHQSAAWMDEMERKLHTHSKSHQEELSNFRQSHKKAFYTELQNLKSALQEKITILFDDSRKRHLSCETEIAKLKAQSSSQGNVTANISDEIERLTDNAVTRMELLDTMQVHEEGMLSRIEAMVQEVVQDAVEKQQEHLEAETSDLQDQIDEITEQVETAEQRQDSNLKLLRAENQQELKKVLEGIENDRAVLYSSVQEQALNTCRDRISAVEDQFAGIVDQVEGASIEVQERLDYEFAIFKAGYNGEVSKMQKSLENQDWEHRQRCVALEEKTADFSSRTKALAAAVTKCSHDIEELGQRQTYANNSLDVLSSKTSFCEEALGKSQETHGLLVSKVDAMSSDLSKATSLLASRGQNIENTRKELFAKAETAEKKLEQVEAKLDEVESETRCDFESTEQKHLILLRQVEDLSGQVHQQCESSFEHQKEYHFKTSELSGFIELLNMKVENQGMLHKEKLDKVVLRVDERFDKVENELQESSFGSKAQEAHSSRSDGGGSSSRRECQPTPDNLSSKHAETADGDAANCRSANESHSLQASSIANTTDVSSISLAPLSETEERYVSLSTKLVTFSGELQRRDESVAALEMHAKEKSDSYSSRAEVLNTEIELQRQQLKKFEETTHRSEARLIEARKKLREFEMSVNRCREELVLRDERVSDIDDDLEEECLSTSVRSRLGSRRRQQKEHRDEWKKKVSEMESSLKMDKAECSKLAAKQELYEGELDRRRAVLNALRSSLSSVLESVAVERESIHSELLSRRQERDTWRKSISDLICVLETIEVESSGVERLQALPVVKQAICVRSGRIRPPRGSCRGVRDEDHSIDSETLQPHSQVAVLSETTELLGRQLQESNSQCQMLAEKVEQMEFDLQRQGSQATEVEALKLDVASSESQMVMFREDQMSLRTDIYTQVDSLRKKLQALEEQYQATSKVSVSQPNDATSYKDLSARVEGLAAQFKDHGDIVAQVGALVDSIQACEVRLSLFEKQQDDTKADVSSMIEFFKTDLQSLKQLCEQAMMRKDAEFSDLICKVESLMVVSQAHGKHLEAVEREAEESSIAVHTQIQTGHLVQQMKEKYIDLAAKVDLLSSEVSESSQEREDQEHRAKDRDAMYLMQLQSVRDDFDSQQSKYQHQIQLRIYNAMVYLLQCIAKREGRPSALPVWNSREEELALQHRQTKKAGERKEGDSSTATWSQKPGLGYSMASGIIRANMLRPVMLASTMNTGAAIKKEEN